MQITKIRHVDGKETRIEWTQDEGGEISEHKRVSKQAPETAFTDALKAFAPLVVKALNLSDAWAQGLAITGLSFGEEKAKGTTRLNVIVHTRYTADTFSPSPIFLNTPLVREAREDGEVGKAGYMPADWDDAIEEVKKQAIRFLQGHRFQESLPLAPAA